MPTTFGEFLQFVRSNDVLIKGQPKYERAVEGIHEVIALEQKKPGTSCLGPNVILGVRSSAMFDNFIHELHPPQV